MGIIKHPKLEALERECSENLKAALDEAEAFQFAEFDAKEVERTGYSNYSYWSAPSAPSARTSWRWPSSSLC